MSLNPTISKLRAFSNHKLAGEHSLTTGELIAFVLLCLVLFAKDKIPIIKGWKTNTATLGAVALLFLVLYLD